ncbi:MAG TPA: hypothetical protein VKB25_01095 [Conexibacter sp.]|nr:hypothetical protein [Conexibacter sp.]
MHRKVAAALVAALALAVASCGGSETTTLSRAELVRQVEVACREGRRAGEEQARESRGDAGAFIDAVLANQKAVSDKIDSIEASGAAKADWGTFKSGMQTRLDAIERVASADRADQQRVIRSIQAEVEAATRRVQAASRSLGIEGCI